LHCESKTPDLPFSAIKFSHSGDAMSFHYDVHLRGIASTAAISAKRISDGLHVSATYWFAMTASEAAVIPI
jgi:hypothetical protein